MPTILVAYDENRLIGNDNKLPDWSLPYDLKIFKKRTLKQSVIMGRKTWDSLPLKSKPLKGRNNIILSNTVKKTDNPALQWVNNCRDAIKCCKTTIPFIIGGSEIFKLFLEEEIVDTVIATEVIGKYKGNVYFPDINKYGVWDAKEIARFQEFKIIEYITIKKMRADYKRFKGENLELKQQIIDLKRSLSVYKKFVHKKKDGGKRYWFISE